MLVSPRFGLRASDLVLLGVAASFRPLGVIARNPVGMVHPERLVLLALVALIAAVGVSWLLMSFGVQRSTAVRSVFIAAVALMSGGEVLRHFDDLLGWGIVLAVIGLASALIARLGDSVMVNAAVVGLAVALVAGVALSYFGRPPLGEDTVARSGPLELQMTMTPDIYLVVLDGYPGLGAFELDTDDTRSELRSELEARGFQVPESAWSSYWSTELSISSLLDMSYPLVEQSGGLATRQRLYDMIGGDARLVDVLKANGYETMMIESGWSGSSCGRAFDRCVASPWFDEALFLAAWDTVGGPYLHAKAGSPFTVGAQHAMEWLLAHSPDRSTDAKPRFVFAHLVAPHPPFFLNEECETVVSDERAGLFFYRPGVPDHRREAFFVGQVACLDTFMTRLADTAGDEDILIFVSDHGTDRRDQLTNPEHWTSEAVVERMNILTAIRTGRACDIGDMIVTPNVMRRVLSCYATSTVQDVPTRIFLPGLIELEPGEVRRLLKWDKTGSPFSRRRMAAKTGDEGNAPVGST